MECHIGRARVSDARLIANVHVASWQAAYRGIIPDAILDALDVSEREARWIANIRETHRTVLLAKVDGLACGFCSFEAARDADLSAADGQITAIYVTQEHWGHGPGQALFEAALLALAQAGFSSASVWVLEENARARRFYEKYGFEPDGAAQRAFDQLPAREIRYRGNLEVALPESLPPIEV